MRHPRGVLERTPVDQGDHGTLVPRPRITVSTATAPSLPITRLLLLRLQYTHGHMTTRTPALTSLLKTDARGRHRGGLYSAPRLTPQGPSAWTHTALGPFTCSTAALGWSPAPPDRHRRCFQELGLQRRPPEAAPSCLPDSCGTATCPVLPGRLRNTKELG